jgi:hypothetical protein
MRLGPRTRTLLLAGASLLLVGLVGGFLKFKRFVDQDPRLCATCHKASPEFRDRALDATALRRLLDDLWDRLLEALGTAEAEGGATRSCP